MKLPIIKTLSDTSWSHVYIFSKFGKDKIVIKQFKYNIISRNPDYIHILKMLKKKCFKNIIQIKSLKYSILTNTRIKFEYFPYLDIFEYSQNYKLTNEEKKNILYDIAYAIYNLHFNNICHGDLKLENILYNPNSDFPKINPVKPGS